MTPLTIFAIVVMAIALILFAVAAVLISANAREAFLAWLGQRERERLSATDKAELDRRFKELDAWRTEVKTYMANNRR